MAGRTVARVVTFGQGPAAEVGPRGRPGRRRPGPVPLLTPAGTARSPCPPRASTWSAAPWPRPRPPRPRGRAGRRGRRAGGPPCRPCGCRSGAGPTGSRWSTTPTTPTRPRWPPPSRPWPPSAARAAHGGRPRRDGRARPGHGHRARPHRPAGHPPGHRPAGRGGGAGPGDGQRRPHGGHVARGGRGRADPDAALALLTPVLGPADVVLVKASRVVALDRVADALLAPRTPGGRDPDRGRRRPGPRAGRDAPGHPDLPRRGLGQLIQVDLPDAHQTKRGTPTMGGAVIILGAVAGYLVVHLFSRGRVPFTPAGLLVVVTMVLLGTVGSVDDYLKIRNQRSLGLTKTAKFAGQAFAAIVLGVGAWYWADAFRASPSSAPRRHRAAPDPVPGLGVPAGVGHLQRGQPDRRHGRPRLRVDRAGGQRLRGHRVLAVPPPVRAPADTSGCYGSRPASRPRTWPSWPRP